MKGNKFREKVGEEIVKIKREIKLLKDDFKYETDKQKEINGN